MEEYILSKTGHSVDIKCYNIFRQYSELLKCATNVMILVGKLYISTKPNILN